MNKDEKLFVEATLRREGWPKITNRAADNGGLTKGGITKIALAEFRKRPVTDDELRNLTLEEAAAIFAFQYLKPYAWIPDTAVRTFCADLAVMTWHDDPARMLQYAAGAHIDGIVGKETREKVLLLLRLNRTMFFHKMYEWRQKFHCSVAFDKAVDKFLDDNPTSQLNNLRGWLNRMAEWV